MKHEKTFYQDLPKVNGFKWAFYDDGFHCFTRQKGDQWEQSYVKESDIEDGFYVNILSFGLSRK